MDIAQTFDHDPIVHTFVSLLDKHTVVHPVSGKEELTIHLWIWETDLPSLFYSISLHLILIFIYVFSKLAYYIYNAVYLDIFSPKRLEISVLQCIVTSFSLPESG